LSGSKCCSTLWWRATVAAMPLRCQRYCLCILICRFIACGEAVPRALQGGKYKNAHPRLSKAGNRHVCRIIWLLAVGAVRHPGSHRDSFDRRTAAGKDKMASLVAVGRKLLITIYAILKTGQPYDPSYQSPGAPPPGVPAAAVVAA